MTDLEQERKIYNAVSAVTEDLGLELVEVKIGRHKSDVFIQVLADKPDGKISLEECTRLNRSIVETIDKEGFFSEDGYSLEVSSPGLDRPLLTHKDFSRNINNTIHLWLKEKVLDKTEYQGLVKSVNQENLVLISGKDKKEIVIPIEKVMKGLLDI